MAFLGSGSRKKKKENFGYGEGHDGEEERRRNETNKTLIFDISSPFILLTVICHVLK